MELSAPLLALVPLVIGMTELVKRAGLSARYAPFASLAFGLLFTLAVGTNWGEVVLGGLVVGLSASGLYSGAKKLAS